VLDIIAKRSTETSPSTRANPGIEVTFPNGAKHFFPGGTEQMAMAIAICSSHKDKLADKGTQIEFGFRSGGEFFGEKITKPKVEDVQRPTTPTKR